MTSNDSQAWISPAESCIDRRRICYVCTWNHLGGTETLILRHLQWLREKGHIGLVISPEGTMSDAYRKSAATFVELTESQADSVSMDDDELAQRNEHIANAVGRDEPCHFIVFNLDGLHMAAELCSLIKGSAVSVYLVFDDIFGPERFEKLEEMNAQGMVIAMNEGCLEGHRRRYGYRLENSILVPLPMAVPKPSRAKHDENECIILTVARLVDMKGYIEGLIADFSDIAKSVKIPCRLVVVGAGPLRHRFIRAARQSGMESKIEFVGSVPYEELAAYYAQAHIYVGMGTTLLEAAAAEVPSVIATAYTKDFVTPGIFGPGSGLGLGEPFCGSPQIPGRELLRHLVTSPSARVSAGKAGRAKVVSDFEQDVVMQKFLGQLDHSAFRVGRFRRPRHVVPFYFLRKHVKRLIGYHPIPMRIGRAVSLALAKSYNLTKNLFASR